MLDPLYEADSGIYLKKSGVDRSVGYLIAGVIVLLFFLLAILGMGRIQHLNDGVPSASRSVPEEKASEIGDVQGSGVKE